MNIIERDEWGAAPVTGFSTARWGQDVTLWVHYTAGHRPEATPEAEAREMRNIQSFHQGPQRGWLDIGYHFVIGPSGRVYRGRPAHTFGAHAPGANGQPGVCLMLGVGQYPTPAQLQSLRDLGGYLGALRMRPHRAIVQTGCPGDILVPWVEAWRPGPIKEGPLPTWIDTLQVVINPGGDKPRRRWTGAPAWGALVWLARYGHPRLHPDSAVAIAYRAHPDRPYRVERDRGTVLSICRALHKTYPKGNA